MSVPAPRGRPGCVLWVRQEWAALTRCCSATEAPRGVKRLFSSSCRGDNDEEEPPKLKVEEHHGISVTGLQSPGKQVHRAHRGEVSLRGAY